MNWLYPNNSIECIDSSLVASTVDIISRLHSVEDQASLGVGRSHTDDFDDSWSAVATYLGLYLESCSLFRESRRLQNLISRPALSKHLGADTTPLYAQRVQACGGQGIAFQHLVPVVTSTAWQTVNTCAPTPCAITMLSHGRLSQQLG